MLQWVKQAWESLSPELLIKSFKSCALTIATDGSEDDEIHCLKNGQPCYPAMKQLRMACITKGIVDLTIEEDEEEEEANEVLIDFSDTENDTESEFSDSEMDSD
jgi:hypothetical protein